MKDNQKIGWDQRVLLLFWNQQEKRVRAFWRILGTIILVLIVPPLLTAVAVRPLDLPLALTYLLSNGISLLVAIGVVVSWARHVDRRELRAYGFRFDSNWWLMLALSVLVGILGWGGAFATDIVFGWARVSATVSPGTGEMSFLLSLSLFALSYVFVGIWEEIIFRGVVMRNAIEGLNFTTVSYRTALVGGWVLSSVLFGLLHFAQATSPLALVFWILAGLIFGLAYLLTDELAVPIGLHFAFDFSANNIFGFANIREGASEIPMIIRPAFTGSTAIVGVSGTVNTIWLVIIGVLTVVVINWQSDSLQLRIEPYSRSENDQ